MPVRLDRSHADFDQRFAHFLGAKREVSADVEAAARAIVSDVAARRDILDDGARGRLDVSGNLALGAEELRKSLVEIGARAVQSNRHGASCWGIRQLMQWRGGLVPSTLGCPQIPSPGFRRDDDGR